MCCGALLITFFLSFPVCAVDFMYRDKRGFRHFSCGVAGRGGRVTIKKLRGIRYKVESRRYSGILEVPESDSNQGWCTGIDGAARMICHECPMPTSHQKKH